MIKIALVALVAFVALTMASPRSLHVQESAHAVAKSVKSSDSYSLEEKREILANLKKINNDAKEYDSASGHRKAELKKDLHKRLAQLKEEVHESNIESSSSSSFEEDDEAVQSKIEAVHRNIKSVKEELQSKKLNHADKVAAKSLVRQLEEGYASLSHMSTKAERSQVARSMKKAVSQLRKYLSPTASLESIDEKKEKIMSLVKSSEKEYDTKEFPSNVESQIHREFEQMKRELKSEKDAHELHDTLKSHLNTIKKVAEKAEHNEGAYHKIQQDVQEIRRSLETEKMSSSDKSAIKSKLSAIESEAKEFAQATTVSERSELKSALKQNFSALRKEFEQAKNRARSLEQSEDEDKEQDFEEDDE
eukprot:c3_g1_i1.p1 GENE.c3_g1_i1~~c3_g1_i1.p1  ORF type:complete len:379 (+),score=157.00 c3_g1_i1:49-1137(+)